MSEVCNTVSASANYNSSIVVSDLRENVVLGGEELASVEMNDNGLALDLLVKVGLDGEEPAVVDVDDEGLVLDLLKKVGLGIEEPAAVDIDKESLGSDLRRNVCNGGEKLAAEDIDNEALTLNHSQNVIVGSEKPGRLDTGSEAQASLLQSNVNAGFVEPVQADSNNEALSSDLPLDLFLGREMQPKVTIIRHGLASDLEGDSSLGNANPTYVARNNVVWESYLHENVHFGWAERLECRQDCNLSRKELALGDSSNYEALASNLLEKLNLGSEKLAEVVGSKSIEDLACVVHRKLNLDIEKWVLANSNNETLAGNLDDDKPPQLESSEAEDVDAYQLAENVNLRIEDLTIDNVRFYSINTHFEFPREFLHKIPYLERVFSGLFPQVEYASGVIQLNQLDPGLVKPILKYVQTGLEQYLFTQLSTRGGRVVELVSLLDYLSVQAPPLVSFDELQRYFVDVKSIHDKNGGLTQKGSRRGARNAAVSFAFGMQLDWYELDDPLIRNKIFGKMEFIVSHPRTFQRRMRFHVNDVYTAKVKSRLSEKQQKIIEERFTRFTRRKWREIEADDSSSDKSSGPWISSSPECSDSDCYDSTDDSDYYSSD